MTDKQRPVETVEEFKLRIAVIIRGKVQEIRVFDEFGAVIETHEHKGESKGVVKPLHVKTMSRHAEA